MRADVAFTALGQGEIRRAGIHRAEAARAGIRKSASVAAASVAAVLVLLAGAALPVAAAETINVILDQAKIAKVPDHASTIVVGNPLIADVSIQTGGTMVVTGKGYGVTNLITLDRTGKVLSEQFVRVKSPVDNVVVYRGIARESYSCAPYCERRITLGDSPEYFDATLGQTGNRNGRAQQGQTGAPGR